MKLSSEQKEQGKGRTLPGMSGADSMLAAQLGGCLGALPSGDPGNQRTDRPGGPRTGGDPPRWLVMQMVAAF